MVPTVNSSRVARRDESVDVLPYGGVAPTHLVGPHRVVPVARLAGSRDRRPAPSAQRSAEKVTEAADIQRPRSTDLHCSFSHCSGDYRRSEDRRARNRHPLASLRLPSILALEIALPPRPTTSPLRHSPIDPGDEPGKSALGRAAHPRRTAQARDRRRTNLGRQIYGETPKAPFARMENTFCATMPMASQQWICSSFQPSPFDCSMAC